MNQFDEIKDVEQLEKSFKQQHDELSERFYTLHEIDKETFDALHAGLWQDYMQRFKQIVPQDLG